MQTCCAFRRWRATFPTCAGSRGEDQFALLAAELPGYQLVEGIAVDVRAAGRLAPAVRQCPVQPSSRAAGIPASAAVSRGSGGAGHAARRGRGGGAGALGSGARDDHAPCLLFLDASARPRLSGCAGLQAEAAGHEQDHRPPAQGGWAVCDLAAAGVGHTDRGFQFPAGGPVVRAAAGADRRAGCVRYGTGTAGRLRIRERPTRRHSASTTRSSGRAMPSAATSYS